MVLHLGQVLFEELFEGLQLLTDGAPRVPSAFCNFFLGHPVQVMQNADLASFGVDFPQDRTHDRPPVGVYWATEYLRG